MKFLSVGAFWWLLLSAVIIFFYLLKIKRQRRVVPSVFLWQRALDDLEANTPFKRLRRSLLMLLQLIALAALVLALARPLLTTRALAAGNSVIVIDATASMSARDEDGKTRLERAKQLALEMVDSLSGDERAAIIESAARVTVRSALTSDRAALASAIGAITETDVAGNLADALQLASQIAKAERDANLVIISDGSGPGTAARSPSSTATSVNLSAARQVGVRFVQVGKRAENVGIVALNSRPSPSGNRHELFASVANFSEQSRTISLELRLDNQLVDARAVSVEAKGRAALIFDGLPESGGLVEVKLVSDDDLASDDLAYAFLPGAQLPRVAVSSDNPFVIRALAVNSSLDVRRLDAISDLSQVDCIVSEGAIRQDVLDSKKPILAIHPADVAGLWQTISERQQPHIASIDRAHPVNAYLSYADLHLESVPERTAAAWLRPVVGSATGGLIFAGENEGRRAVMLSFDLAKSDLPLKVEFPILLANSIGWLTGGGQASEERVVRAGQPITLRTAAANVSLKTPDGETREVETRDGLAVFADTMRAGLYQAEGVQPFAVSLLSEAESDTAPRDSIQTREGVVSGQAEDFNAEREVWKWAAILALAVLAFEWWVYHRRVAS